MSYVIIEGSEPDMNYVVKGRDGEPLEFTTLHDAKTFGWYALRLDEFIVQKFTPEKRDVNE